MIDNTPSSTVSRAATTNPDIDERVWHAWVDKNRERDRKSFKRRATMAKYLAAGAVIAGIIWKYLN